MPLPPDPHDDDVADPSAAPPPPPPPPPPPAAADPFTSVGEPAAARPEPPSSPAYAPPPPRPTVNTRAPRAEPTEPPRPSPSSPESSPESSPDQGHAPGRSRLGWMIAAVVAVIVAAGGVVLATGGDDDDTPAPAADETLADETPAVGTPADETPAGGTPADETPAGETPAEVGAPVDAAGGESPVEVADAFFAAAASGDCDGMVDRMTLESFSAEGLTPSQALAECESDVAGGGTGLAVASFGEVTLVSEQGDQATVAVDVVLAGEEVHEEFPLRLIDGEWKLHLEASSQP